MKVAIISNTFYQLFNAIVIKNNYYKDCEVDLFICNSFNYEQPLSKIKNENIFSNIYEVNLLDKNNLYNKVVFLSGELKKYIKNYSQELDKPCYDRMIFYNDSNFAYTLYFNIKKINTNIELFFYEDGTGSYVYKNWAEERQESKIFLLHKLLNRSLFKCNEIKGMYVYLPELIKKEYWDRTSIIRLNLDENLKEKIKNIFEIHNQNRFKNKDIIFFDQPLSKDTKETYLINERNILNDLIKFINKKRLIIKCHPRQDDTFEDLGIDSYKSCIPWEVEVLNLNFNEKILISFGSTALLTPFIIMQKKPKIIFCYDIYGKKYKNYFMLNEFVLKVKKLYGDNLIILKDINDLSNLLI